MQIPAYLSTIKRTAALGASGHDSNQPSLTKYVRRASRCQTRLASDFQRRTVPRRLALEFSVAFMRRRGITVSHPNQTIKKQLYTREKQTQQNNTTTNCITSCERFARPRFQRETLQSCASCKRLYYAKL